MSPRFLLATVTLATFLLVAPWQQSASATSCVPSEPSSSPDVVPVAAPASPMAQQTRIHWTRFSRRIVFGDVATLEGQVVTADGAVGGAAVDLYSRTSADEDWTHMASATSDSDTGVFAFGCRYPRRSTEYRVVHEGTVLLGRSSDAREVGVARQVPDDMKQVARSRLLLHGAVAPRYDGPVTLQRRTCPRCAWRAVDVRDTRARSRWRFPIDVATKGGEVAYRVTIPPDGRFVRSFGDHVWRITVR